MRPFAASLKSSLIFYLGIFVLQVVLFFIVSPYYSASPTQTQLPFFIKWSMAKYFGLVGTLYFVWAMALGILNGLAFRKSKVGLRWNAAQYLTLLLLVTIFYPWLFNQFPPLDRLPLLLDYLLLFAAALACGMWAFPSASPGSSRRLWAGGLTLLLPMFFFLALMRPARLDLPVAPPTLTTDRLHLLLLGFDALDGDSGNPVLLKNLQGSGARIYTNAFTPLPLTNPAWNSILSGLYPDKHRVRFFFGSPQTPLYPELYLPYRLKREAGYRTLFASDQPETSFFTAQEGFDESVLSVIGWKAHLEAMVLNHFIFPALWLNNPWTEGLSGRNFNSASVYNYDLARFFNQAFKKFSKLGEGPRFMALHTCFLHSPIRLTGREVARLPGHLWLRPRDFSFWKWPPPGTAKTQTPETWVNPYYVRREEELQFLQTLLRQLKEKSYLEAASLAFFSDHGERFSNNFEIYGGIHGVDLKTREQNNVMLAIADPRFKGSEIVARWVSLIDLAPSFLKLLRLKSEGMPYDGVALMNEAGDELDPPPRPLLAESMGFIDDPTEQNQFPNLSIQSLEQSLIYHPDGQVVVGPSYYERILQKKEFADLTKVPEMRQWKEGL